MASPITNVTPPLHLSIRMRLDKLRQQCEELYGDIENGRIKTVSKSDIPQPLREFYSNVQLWKECSLHHTLEALDKANDHSADSQIVAIENHEKGARELFALTQTFLQRTREELVLQLGSFADDLTELVHGFTLSKLEEQRLVHVEVVKCLENEKKSLAIAFRELQCTNAVLEDRVEALENAPTSGGDAKLCNKLRTKMHHLVLSHREVSAELEVASEERMKHRRDLEKTKAQLAHSQKALALTRAMNEKETKQLAAMIQINQAQVAQVLDASRTAAVNAAISRNQQQPLERFDPLSGCMIVHLAPMSTPQKPTGSSINHSPRQKSSPLFTASSNLKQLHTSPPGQRRRLERPKSATPAGRRRSDPAVTNGKKTTPSSKRFLHHPQT